MTTPDRRTALINGLVDLAAFLEANPEAPIPSCPTFHHFATGTDTNMRAEIDAIAALLGTVIDPGDLGYGHYRTSIAFGPIEYTAVGILAAARARHDADTSYTGCVDPTPITPAGTPARAA